jgi:hypothetical protein
MTMNVENILKVADAIEQHSIPDLGFNMLWLKSEVGGDADRSGHNCGTVACVAGWTIALFGSRGDGFMEAGQHLGLPRSKYRPLFYPGTGLDEDEADTHPAWGATPAQAASCLRHLAETGEVDWDRAIKAAEASAQTTEATK